MNNEMDINSILKDFYNISGFRVSIHDLEYNEIYSYPLKLSPFCEKVQENRIIKEKCISKDSYAFSNVKNTGKIYIYKCHCGLYEAVAPIYNYGVLSGFFMMGQVCDDKIESKQSISKYVSKLNFREDISKYISDIKTFNENEIYSYIRIMNIIAEYITKTNKLNSYSENTAPLIKKYINMNFDKKVTLNILSQKFDCCNSNLIKSFKNEYGITIIEYLNNVRLENAEKMIKSSNKSFKEISTECGFYDQNYFSKQFTKCYGVTPSKYRIMQKSGSIKQETD